MKKFKGTITLAKNSRGCYIIDTVKGCRICRDEKPMGCYDNCYARDIAKRYRFDFGNIIKRDFDIDNTQLFLFDMSDEKHANDIINAISKIRMPFVRIGEMGDPSYAWDHTVNVCEKISQSRKQIVIITKHWEIMSDEAARKLSDIDVCVNTSISALDRDDEIHHRLVQYERMKKYCHSVLRVVTCNFNTETKQGIDREIMQQYLMGFDNVLETVFRPSADNHLVTSGLIHVNKQKFLGSTSLVSMRDSAYTGYCDTCPDMCGIKEYVNTKGVRLPYITTSNPVVARI